MGLHFPSFPRKRESIRDCVVRAGDRNPARDEAALPRNLSLTSRGAARKLPRAKFPTSPSNGPPSEPLLRGSPITTLLLAALLTTPLSAQDAKGPPPAPVAVALAESRALAPVTWYPGTVISRNQARVAAEVPGRLEWVAEVGTVIAEGETVAQVDDALFTQSVAENEAAVAREQARLNYLGGQVERLETLVTQNTATRSRLDEAIAERDIARSELRAVRARVALTRERLNRTRIKAPFGGVVTKRFLRGGEWAQSGEPVVRIVDVDSLEVQTWIPVAALAFVHEGGELVLEANPGTTSGTVHAIVPVGDNQSRLYELRLRIGDEVWPVGQDVRVAIPTAAARTVTAVPRDALVLRRDGTAVYRVGEDDIAERVPVTTGIAEGPLIEVDGIVPGDRVVIRGGERLRPGQVVSIQTAPSTQ